MRLSSLIGCATRTPHFAEDLGRQTTGWYTAGEHGTYATRACTQFSNVRCSCLLQDKCGNPGLGRLPRPMTPELGLGQRAGFQQRVLQARYATTKPGPTTACGQVRTTQLAVVESGHQRLNMYCSMWHTEGSMNLCQKLPGTSIRALKSNEAKKKDIAPGIIWVRVRLRTQASMRPTLLPE